MHHFPFSAVVGADDLTLARALTSLLPEVRVVAGCRFSCDPDRPDTACPDGPHQGPAAVSRPARLVELPCGHVGPVSELVVEVSTMIAAHATGR